MNISEVKRRGLKIKALSFLHQIENFILRFSKEILCFFAGAVLSFAKLYGTNVFGISFICACGTRNIFALAGALTSALLGGKDIIFVAASVLGVIFQMFLKKNNITGAINSVISSSLCASLLGIKDISIIVPLAVTSAVFSFAYTGLFHEKRSFAPAMADVGFLSLAFSMTLAFSRLGVGWFDFSVVTAAYFCFEGAQRGGYLLGGLAGFFSGMALGAEYIVPLVLCGFVCGMYIRKFSLRAIFASVVIGCVFGVIFSSEIDYVEFVVSLLWSGIIWILSSDILYDRKKANYPSKQITESTESMKRLSAAVGSISLMLSSVSKAKRRAREDNIRMVVEGVFCAECETCFGCALPTERTKLHLCNCVYKNKKINHNDFSENFKSNCSHWEMIRDKLNIIIEENPEKTELRIDTLAKDYMSMSRLLALGEQRAENRCFSDTAMAKKIKMALELKNIRVMSVNVTGTRLPSVEICGIPFKLPFPEKAITSTVEKILCKKVKIAVLETEGKTTRMKLKSVCGLKVDFYKISLAKKGEIICGDSTASFEDDEGYFYSVISDGMGSGRDAAVCSRLGTSFLEKLISAGIDKAGAVSMLGGVIASSGDEVFTTVDLVEIDLVRKKLTLIKAGAAPTWILRDGKAYSVSSKTMPCGIISKTNAEQTILDCFSGDYVIMASDGGECAASDVINYVLREKKNFSSKDIASCLVDTAVKINGRNDDISFCVMSIL